MTLGTNEMHAQTDYDKRWKQVEEQELQGLIKSASALVDTILRTAKKEKNGVHTVKGFLYASKFSLLMEEDAQQKVVRELQGLIAVSEFPTKAMLQSVYAGFLEQYLDQYRFILGERTPILDESPSPALETWDLDTLLDQIAEHYRASLENPKGLQEIPIQAYAPLLTKDRSNKNYRPTLFDFLAHRALEFHKREQWGVDRPGVPFLLVDPMIFAPSGEFTKARFDSKDSVHSHLPALKLFQALEDFHQGGDTLALVDLQLHRLKFARDNTALPTKGTHYRQALEKLREVYPDHPVWSTVTFELADALLREDQGPGADDPHFKGPRVRAVELCDRAIQRFPNSDGALRCGLLKHKIEKRELDITMEQFVAPDRPFPALVEHTNIDSLHILVFPLSMADFLEQKRKAVDSLVLELIKSKKPMAHGVHRFRGQKDHYAHRTEIALGPLPLGGHLLVVSQVREPRLREHLLAYQKVQVTNLALLAEQSEGTLELRLLDRSSGQPIPGAEVRVVWGRGKKQKGEDIQGKTDPLGHFQIDAQKGLANDILVSIEKDGDRLDGQRFWVSQRSQSLERDERRAQMSLFLDRSIYRPGQTLYFKGILTDIKKERTQVVPNRWVTLFIYGANGEELQEFRLKTNDFGSVHGEYKIPKELLTGNFRMEMDQDHGPIEGEFDYYWYKLDEIEKGVVTFSVEEYKRPRFKVAFEPVKDKLSLGGPVSIKGSAQALMGTSIKGARVNYTVERQTGRHGHGYYGVQGETIAQGETLTDAEGHFTVPFTALPPPDSSLDEHSIFTFDVMAEVTDANGETRSGKSSVLVGRKNLRGDVQLGATLERDGKNSFLVTTKDLNGQPLPARLEIEYFPLEEPGFVHREKPWEVVGSPNIEKDRYRKLFPHEPYDSTDLRAQWPKGRPLYRSVHKSRGNLRVELPDTRSWETGPYAVSIKIEDPSGETLEMERHFDLLDSKLPQLPKSQLLAHRVVNTDFIGDGHIHLQFTTATDGLRIFLDGHAKGKAVYQGNLDLKNVTTDLKVPVQGSMGDKIEFKLYFIRYNSLHWENFEVKFPMAPDALSIETLSFRNRLAPDAKETWSFKVVAPHQKGVLAEVMASMYDASLDQFRKHRWIPSLGRKWHHYPYIPGINGHQSFGTLRFWSLDPGHPVDVARLLYDHQQLEWFGLSFPESEYSNKRYLKRLKSKEGAFAMAAGNISGLVTDPMGRSIPGANVMISGTQVGTQTDYDGFYALDVPLGSTLVFSYIGHKNKELEISTTGTHNMILEQDSQALEEVVVLGNGQDREKMVDEDAVLGLQRVTELNEMGSLGLQVSQHEGGPEGEDQTVISGLGYGEPPLFIIDGTPYAPEEGEELALSLKTSDILDITVLKGEAATAIYGTKGSKGAVIITTKKGMAGTLQVEARTDLRETAFFFPDLTTDNKGNIHITFDSPQALTQWRFMMLAHTKGAEAGLLEKMAVTQKDLSLVPNYPRFFREGDTLVFSTKIVNLTPGPLTGTAILQAFDAQSGEPLEQLPVDGDKAQGFQLPPQGEGSVSWPLAIPAKINAIELKTVAKAGDRADGEAMVIPVLSKRSLITESKAFLAMPGKDKEIVLDKLLHGHSPTLEQQGLTLEYTSNPAWTAIKSLPYLMEFPHDCAEQVFSRYYANVLAEHIAGSDPKIQQVFGEWEASGTLGSPMENNAELRSILISESPWAQDPKQERARLGRLFKKNSLEAHKKDELDKLMGMQLSSGGFPWFSGGNESPFISRHILAGFGHLITLGALQGEEPQQQQMIKRTVEYLDGQLVETYRDKDNPLKLVKMVPGNHELHYMYARSFFLGEHPLSAETEKIHGLLLEQLQGQWLTQSLYNKGLIALVMWRNGKIELAKKIVDALLEQAVQGGENGIYWKENIPNWWWYRAPIETQALIIEAFAETGGDPEVLEGMKLWLLNHKRTHGWPTTKATTEAIYALLLQGRDWLALSDNTTITVGGKPIPTGKLEVVKKEAGTGYLKIHWPAQEVSGAMGRIKIANQGGVAGFGGVHWQYFEDSDKVEASEPGPLQVEKGLFLHERSTDGERLLPLVDGQPLAIGDLVTVRLVVTVREELEFVHLKDTRAAGLEPVEVLSGHHWQDGLRHYRATKDVATHFFFDSLPRGTHVLEYQLRVNNSGDFSIGISTLQSMYAPEFSAHSKGGRIRVD